MSAFDKQKQVSKGMFRSKQAWSHAHQDTEAQSAGYLSSIPGVPYPGSLNMAQTQTLPSLSHSDAVLAYLSTPSNTLPNFSLGSPLYSKTPCFTEKESFSSLLTSLPGNSRVLPNFPHAMTSFSQPPRVQPTNHDDHLSPSCEPELQHSSKNVQTQSQSTSYFSQDTNGGSNDDENDKDGEDEPNLEDSIEILDENGVVRQRHKMTYKDVLRFRKGEKVIVHINEYGQPIGDARRVLTRWMTEIVNEPNLCPPDVKDFGELKKICGCQLLRLVRANFSFPKHNNVDNVLMSMFNVKFRNNKYKIAKKLYNDAEATLREKLEQELINEGYRRKDIEKAVEERQFEIEELEKEFDNLPRPKVYATHKWLKLVNHFKSPDYKRLSCKGKAARKKHSHAHTTGTTSFAQKKVEYIKKKKRKPGYIEFIDFTHKKKDGTYARDKSSLYMKFAMKKMEEYRDSGKYPNEYAIQKEAWDFCMGEDIPGRARGFGVGVTKSQVQGFKAELMEMRNEGLTFDHCGSMDKKLREQFADYKASTDATIKALQPELQLYRTAYMSGVDPLSQANVQNQGGTIADSV